MSEHGERKRVREDVFSRRFVPSCSERRINIGHKWNRLFIARHQYELIPFELTILFECLEFLYLYIGSFAEKLTDNACQKDL